MKKILLFFSALFITLSLTQSCGSDDSSDGGGSTTPQVTSITLTANQTSVAVGESITFSVKTNTNQTVTSNAEILVNNAPISGSSFTSNTVGTFSVQAKYNTFTSNSISVTFNPNYQSITLTLSDDEVVIGQETVNFSVEADNGDNVTSIATYKVNGNDVSGTSFDPTAPGTYSVSAEVNGLTDQKSFTADFAPATSITLSADDADVYLGQTITFTVMDNWGQDVTNDATITSNGAAISGNTLSSDVIANFDIVAEFEGLSSGTLQVTFTEQPPSYVQNVLIEDYTGTWCPFCTRVLHALELVDEATDHAIPIGIHRGNDPYNRVNVGALENLIGLTGYPTANINRMTEWMFPESDNIDQITSLAGREADLGLSIATSISGNSVTADVKVNYAKDFDQELELVVYLLEDGLIYDQRNGYPSLYGGLDPIPNFEHNHVLVDVYTNLLGDDMPNGVGGVEYSTSFTETLPNYIENNDNLSVVAFVIDANTNDCLNVQIAHIGETTEYEYFN